MKREFIGVVHGNVEESQKLETMYQHYLSNIIEE